MTEENGSDSAVLRDVIALRFWTRGLANVAIRLGQKLTDPSIAEEASRHLPADSISRLTRIAGEYSLINEDGDPDEDDFTAGLSVIEFLSTERESDAARAFNRHKAFRLLMEGHGINAVKRQTTLDSKVITRIYKERVAPLLARTDWRGAVQRAQVRSIAIAKHARNIEAERRLDGHLGWVEFAAEETGVSSSQIQMALTVVGNGNDRIVRLIDQGAMSLSHGYRIARMDESQQDEELRSHVPKFRMTKEDELRSRVMRCWDAQHGWMQAHGDPATAGLDVSQEDRAEMIRLLEQTQTWIDKVLRALTAGLRKEEVEGRNVSAR